MTAGNKRSEGVLRGAAMHAHPRHLPRSPRHAAQGHAPLIPEHARTAEVEAGFQQGLEEGRAAGLREGLQDAQQQVGEATRAARHEFEQLASQRLQEFQTGAASRLAQLEHLLAGFDAAATRRLAEFESDAIALAFSAVCKVLGEQAVNASTLAAIVQQAMAQLRESTLLAVRMNDRDLRNLLGDEHGRRLQCAAPEVKWIADPAVTSGGCVIDTTAGSLDARLETQLSALRALWTSSTGEAGAPA